MVTGAVVTGVSGHRRPLGGENSEGQPHTGGSVTVVLRMGSFHTGQETTPALQDSLVISRVNTGPEARTERADADLAALAFWSLGLDAYSFLFCLQQHKWFLFYLCVCVCFK